MLLGHCYNFKLIIIKKRVIVKKGWEQLLYRVSHKVIHVCCSII